MGWLYLISKISHTGSEVNNDSHLACHVDTTLLSPFENKDVYDVINCPYPDTCHLDKCLILTHH